MSQTETAQPKVESVLMPMLLLEDTTQQVGFVLTKASTAQSEIVFQQAAIGLLPMVLVVDTRQKVLPVIAMVMLVFERMRI